jgi:hypothetical protein
LFFFFFFNEVGISEGCSICGRLKSKLEQEVCGVLCEIVGIETFAKVLQGSDIDPIYVSFKTHDVSFNFSLGSGLHRTVCLSSKPLLAARLVRVICVLLFRSHCKAKYVHHQRRRAASGLFRSVLAIFFYFYLFFFFFQFNYRADLWARSSTSRSAFWLEMLLEREPQFWHGR